MSSLRYTSEVLMGHSTTNGASDKSLLAKLRHFDAEISQAQYRIKQSLSYCEGTYTFDDVVAAVLKGTMILWTFGTSFALLEVHNFPQKKALHVFLAGGNPEELAAMQKPLREKALQLGCSACTVSGRPGWARYLKPHGWRPVTLGLWIDVEPMEAPHGQGRQFETNNPNQTRPGNRGGIPASAGHGGGGVGDRVYTV